MNPSLRLTLLAACVAVFAVRRSDATVSCYVCTGYVGEANDDCANFKAPTTGSSLSSTTTTTKASNDNSTVPTTTTPKGYTIPVVVDDILIVSGCTSCVTVKATAGSVTTYTRSCSTASSVTTGCVSYASVSTCTYDCTTDLCNTGDARALRYTLASLIGTLFLSAVL
jgi:hypothetical protein